MEYALAVRGILNFSTRMSKWISLLGIFVLDICVLIPEVWGDIKYRDNFSYPISSSKATCLLFNIIQTQRR